MLGTVGTRTDAHSSRSQVGIGSESNRLLKPLDKILKISDSEAGVKEGKSGDVVGEESDCENNVVGLLERDRRWLDILSAKKEVIVKLSSREIHGVEEGNGEEDLQCKRLFTVYQRRLGLSEDDERSSLTDSEENTKISCSKK